MVACSKCRGVAAYGDHQTKQGNVAADRSGPRKACRPDDFEHPWKFGVKRFLALREGLARKWGGLFWATPLEKIFGGVAAIISFRPGGWMQQSAVPKCAILSVGKHGRHRAVKRRVVIVSSAFKHLRCQTGASEPCRYAMATTPTGGPKLGQASQPIGLRKFCEKF